MVKLSVSAAGPELYVLGESEDERKAVGAGGAAMDAFGWGNFGLDDEVGVGFGLVSLARRDI
jgi:hypothetical protein